MFRSTWSRSDLVVGPRGDIAAILGFDEPDPVVRLDHYVDLRVPFVEIEDESRWWRKLNQSCSAHRPDGLQNVRGVSLLTWADLMDVLKLSRDRAARDEERQYAVRAVDWLAAKGLGTGTV